MDKSESEVIQQKVAERLPLASPGEQAIIGMLTLIAGKLEHIEMRMAQQEQARIDRVRWFGGPG